VSVSGSPTSSATTPRRKGSRRKHREACGGGGGATRRARGRPPRRTGGRRSGRRRAGGRSVRSLHAPELLNTKARVITSRSPRGAFKRLVSPRSARIEPGVGVVVDQAEEHDLTASSVVARRGVWWWQAIRCSFVGEQQSDGPFLTHRSTQQTSSGSGRRGSGAHAGVAMTDRVARLSTLLIRLLVDISSPGLAVQSNRRDVRTDRRRK
jgi:hypothetical protein